MGILCCKPDPVNYDGPVDLYHFQLLRAVGRGAFGKVRVVQHKQTKNLYALKYINKAKCIKMHAVSNVIQERRMLEEIESPFICNLRYAFQDDENLFMVLDLMLGGDLRFHLDRSGNMREDIVRFYVAELALALDYLHSMHIVHRDIKPDNILLDDRGHVALTDFNIAVHFTPSRLLTSVAGSMAYMAPEVLSKRGYRSAVDWWSLGVMTYEMLFGHRPFKGKTNSTLTHVITHARYVFPDNVADIVSPEALSFVRGCLERDPNSRLGARGLPDLQAHPWFAGMDWTAISKKEATPPFQPDSKRANFDASHELEELLLEENPLKARRRKEDVDLDSLTPEMRYMEEHFLPFDSLTQCRKTYFPSSGVSRTNSMLIEQPLNETASMTIPGASSTAPTQTHSNGLGALASTGLSVSPVHSASRIKQNGSVYPPSTGSHATSQGPSSSPRIASNPDTKALAATTAHHPAQMNKPTDRTLPLQDVPRNATSPSHAVSEHVPPGAALLADQPAPGTAI